MDDQFLPIEGYPGYRVSKAGEVQSCWTRYRRPAIMTDTWLSLKPVRRRYGHLTVNLSRAGKKLSRPIHRLVLEAWVGPCPPGLICCHNNGLPWDNRVENLRWGSYKSNSEDTLLHGRRSRGENSNSKLKEAEVVQIRRLKAEGVPSRELASRFGVCPGHIESVVNRRCWRHLPIELADDGPILNSVPFSPQDWRGPASC
jgi:hypothetical protein